MSSSSSVSGVVRDEGARGLVWRGHRRTTPGPKLVLDLRTSLHISSDVNLLHDLLGVGRGSRSIRTGLFRIPDVLYVPDLGLGPPTSIISAKKLQNDHGLKVEVSETAAVVTTRQGVVVGRGHVINGLYILDFLIIGQQDDDDAARLVARVLSPEKWYETFARPTAERDSSSRELDDTQVRRNKIATLFIFWVLCCASLFSGFMRWNSDNTHGRVLVGINHDKEHKGGDGMISIDVGMTEMNANGSLKDHKALAPWIPNQTSDQPVKDYGETTKKQNKTGEPRLPAPNKAAKTTMVSWKVIAPAIIFVFVVLCCIAPVIWYKCCRIRGQQIDDPDDQVELGIAIGPIQFQYGELAVATGNFTHENELGHGASGIVYKGRLRIPDRHVAIKVLSTESPPPSQKLNDFNSELKVITQLKHKNIVELVGWCRSNEGLLLVYELMDKGSLSDNLYNTVEILSWEQRFKIIQDLGSALTYLHVNCKEFVFHGDIKPQNVLIDAAYNAKLGDFGTTRLIQHGADPQSTQNRIGTLGYTDPVFWETGARCPQADMYSFGVTLLEIACGERPSSGLLNRVRELYNQRSTLQEPSWILRAADAKLNGEFDQQQMERVLVTGLWCAHQDRSQRPSIVKAMDVIRSADGNLPLVPAVLGPQHIQSMQRLAYYGETSSFHDAVSATTYHTCNDSAYLLAGG